MWFFTSKDKAKEQPVSEDVLFKAQGDEQGEKPNGQPDVKSVLIQG